MSNNHLHYDQLTQEDYNRLNEDLTSADTLDVIKWGYRQFGDELVYACSFGAEGVVLIDIISKVKQDAKVIFLDTNFHFEETYRLIGKVKHKYPSLNIELINPALSVEEQKSQYGDRLWENHPDVCCNIRKIEPLHQALKGVRAWMSGLRREQSPTRANTQYINQDNKFKSIKFCPLIHWTFGEVWQYIKAFDLPYNPLHDIGYPSIGCLHCTRPVAEGEDSRAGRWSHTNKTECGLHTN
jgi:phosphoadenosine phosphosulfate reductase